MGFTNYLRGLLGTRFAEDVPMRDGAPPAGEVVNFKQDEWSSRRLLSEWWSSDIGNPDDVTLSRQSSADAYYAYPYGIFDEMRGKDLHIGACIDLRKQAVLDCDRTIAPAIPDDPTSMMLANWTTWAVDRLGSMEDLDWIGVTSSLLDAVWYGFRVCEMIWGVDTWAEDGKAYWVLDAIRPRLWRRFSFDDQNRLMIIMDSNEAVLAEDNKFVVSRMYANTDSPWGEPLFSQLYNHFKFKKAVTAYWIGYCEKFGQPIPKGWTDETFTGDQDELDRFDTALAGIQQESFIRLAKGEHVEMIEFSRTDSKTLYKDFIEQVNRDISKLCLGATMVLEESSTGARAMAETLADRFLSKVEADAAAVSREWNRQIIRPLIEMNFGPEMVQFAPIMTLTVTEQKDQKSESEIDVALHGIGLDLSEADLYERYGRKQPDSEEDALTKETPPPLALPGAMGLNGLPEGDTAQQAARSDTEFEDDKQFAEALGKFLGAGNQPSHGLVDVLGKIPRSMAAQFLNDFAEASFNSNAIARQADNERQRIVESPGATSLVQYGVDDILQQLREWTLKQSDVADALIEVRNNGLFVSPMALERGLEITTKYSHLAGLNRNAENLAMPVKPDEAQFAEEELPNLPPTLAVRGAVKGKDLLDEFGTWLTGAAGAKATAEEAGVFLDTLQGTIERTLELNILTRPEFDQLDDWAKSQAFTAANQTTKTITAAYEELLLQSLTEGRTLREVADEVYPYWNPPKTPGAKPLVTELHIENVVRTNVMRAYNQGWNDVAFAPGMAARRPAAEFVAIVDDRTTDVCSAMDGKVLMRDEVRDWTPPLHYMCRSILVWLPPAELANKSAADVMTRQQLLELPENLRPLPGFGKYVPTFSGTAA